MGRKVGSTKKVTLERPLCVRFRTEDHERIQRVRPVGRVCSRWVRDLVRAEAASILEGAQTERTYSTAGGEKEQVCVRFLPGDLDVLRQASKKEKAPSVSAWIRAVILAHVAAEFA